MSVINISLVNSHGRLHPFVSFVAVSAAVHCIDYNSTANPVANPVYGLDADIPRSPDGGGTEWCTRCLAYSRLLWYYGCNWDINSSAKTVLLVLLVAVEDRRNFEFGENIPHTCHVWKA